MSPEPKLKLDEQYAKEVEKLSVREGEQTPSFAIKNTAQGIISGSEKIICQMLELIGHNPQNKNFTDLVQEIKNGGEQKTQEVEDWLKEMKKNKPDDYEKLQKTIRAEQKELWLCQTILADDEIKGELEKILREKRWKKIIKIMAEAMAKEPQKTEYFLRTHSECFFSDPNIFSQPTEIENMLWRIRMLKPDVFCKKYEEMIRNGQIENKTKINSADNVKTALSLCKNLNETHTSDLSKHNVGEIGNRYKVIRKLGEGGHGSVDLVLDTETGLLRATKKLTFTQDHWQHWQSHLKCFRKEKKAMALIGNCPTLVQITDYLEGTSSKDGTKDDYPAKDAFIVMEYVRGKDLFDYIKDGPLNRAETDAFKKINRDSVDIVLQLLLSLNIIHTNHLLHRDVKPENIFVVKDSTGKTVFKLFDFGVVAGQNNISPKQKETDKKETEIHPTGSKEDETRGTTVYQAPEVLLSGKKETTQQSDLFSLGCVLYRVLTGRFAFPDVINILDNDGEDRLCERLIYEKRSGNRKLFQKWETPPHTKICANQPFDLEDFIEHLLKYDPNDRPASALDAMKMVVEKIKTVWSPEEFSDLVEDYKRRFSVDLEKL